MGEWLPIKQKLPQGVTHRKVMSVARDSSVVKSATPGAIVCPPTDLGSNAATTVSSLFMSNTQKLNQCSDNDCAFQMLLR